MLVTVNVPGVLSIIENRGDLIICPRFLGSAPGTVAEFGGARSYFGFGASLGAA